MAIKLNEEFIQNYGYVDKSYDLNTSQTNIDQNNDNVSTNGTTNPNNNSSVENKTLEKINYENNNIKSENQTTDDVDYNENTVYNELNFLLPQYGVQDFINERALWQKGIHNLTGEPGWFYFKIFFNFNDRKGLFGGILNNIIPNTSALRYLYGIRNFYKSSKIMDRMLALARFTYTLSYINSICPWFFIGVNGINKLNSLDFIESTKEKSIDIICNGEAIDMRLNTLLDMYRYACYDDINMKEILPENLRKFDMSIIIMNAPIKYFQTGMLVSGQNSQLQQVGSNGDTILNKTISGINKVTNFLTGASGEKFNYKKINGDDNNITNRLSFQMYTLKNCEIDPISFESYLPSGINNTQFFKSGLGSIKINYDRCYKHTFNEWQSLMYGTTGIYYDKYVNKIKNNHNLLSGIDDSKYTNSNISDINEKRIKAIRKSINNTFFDKDTETYKGLIDFSEAVIKDSLINVDNPYYLGNIADTYDINNYGDMWKRTKDNIKNFFKF